MINQPTSVPPTPVAPTPNNPEGAAMTLIEHLVELRTRLVKASIGVLLGLGVGLFLVLGPPDIIDILIRHFLTPDPGQTGPSLIALRPAEEFTSYMKVALGVGVAVGMPAIVYQLLAFIVPGLTKQERRLLFISLPFVMVFFVGGLVFGWFVTVPTAVQFLVGFSNSPNIESLPAVSEFLSFITTLMLINGIVFELPIVIYVLAFLGVFTAAQLGKYRRFAIVIVVIVAAVITPTGDPVNLALLAVPMYFLFELGIILARFVPESRRPS